MLKVSGLNIPKKKKKDWQFIKNDNSRRKHDLTIFFLKETHFKYNNINRLKFFFKWNTISCKN